MPKHHEVRELPWTPEEMFDLVADVRRYPEFLPWVTGMRVRKQTPEEIVADMIVGFRAIKEVFTSRVTLDRPQTIRVSYIDGPLRYLHNDWKFDRLPEGGTRLDFHVDFEFRSRIFEKLAGAFFLKAVNRMVESFEARAEELYGRRSRSATSVA